jgi:hypothetical protein
MIADKKLTNRVTSPENPACSEITAARITQEKAITNRLIFKHFWHRLCLFSFIVIQQDFFDGK